MGDDDSDRVPDPLAELDQLLAGMGDLATLIWTYFLNLKERGFSDKAALDLTIAYQTTFLSNSK